MIRSRADNDSKALNNIHSTITKYAFTDKVRVSLDRLDLTGAEATIDDLHNYLSEKSVSSKNTAKRSKSGELDFRKRVRTYRFFHGKEISLHYIAYKTTDLKQLVTISMQEPSQSLIDFVGRMLLDLDTTVTISKIEIAWDFYVDNIFYFKELVEKHLWLYHNHQGYSYYKTKSHIDHLQATYYLSFLRNSVKGVRVYLRPKDSPIKKYVRVELELHRKIIRELGIQFRLTADQLSKEFTRFLRFCEIDFVKLKEAYLWRLGLSRLKGNDKSCIRTRDLLRQQVGSELNYIQWGCSNLVQQMEEVKKLGLSNPIRFMKPIDELNWIFNDLPLEQGFNL